MKKIDWYFAYNNGGEEEGPNDSLTNYFTEKGMNSLAREIIQNAIDARSSDDAPVKVKFSLEHINVNDIPGVDTIRDVYVRSRQYYGHIDKWDKFCAEAIKEISSNKTIRILRIGDYNTRGLEGKDNDNKGSFYKLTRAVGVNSSTGVGGGSFGIGKGAPFLASKIKTILYSTLNRNKEYIFTGSSRLTSFRDEKGDSHRGTGYLGCVTEKGAESIRDASIIPDVFKRKEIGTDIIILGYENFSSSDDEGDWSETLARSVINNFWFAVYEKDLEVEFTSDSSQVLKIDADTLNEQIEKFHSTCPNDEKNFDAYYYHDAVKNHDNETTDFNLDRIGHCKIYLKFKEGYPKRIQLMRRSKMLIENKSSKTNEEYAGLFICDDVEGNGILRQLEQPAHDKWIKNKDVKSSTVILNEIRDTIRNLILATRPRIESEIVDIPGLEDYLPDSSYDLGLVSKRAGADEDEANGEETYKQVVKNKTVTMESKPLNSKNALMASELEKGGGGSPSSEGKGNGKGGEHSGKEEDGDGNKIISLNNVTFRYLKDGEDDRKIKAYIVSEKDEYGWIGFKSVGDDSDYDLGLSEAIDENNNPMPIKNNKISIYLRGGVARVVQIKFSEGVNYGKLGVK